MAADMHEFVIRQTFGQRVRQLRAQRGWSMDEFCALCGYSKPTLSKIETGQQNVSIPQILTLAAQLQVAVAELFAPLESGIIEEDDPSALAYAQG